MARINRTVQDAIKRAGRKLDALSAPGGETVQGLRAVDLMPGGETAAEKRAAERREVEELRRENTALRGQVDALKGEIASLKREREDHYQRGVRDRDRSGGLTSILRVPQTS